MSDAIVIAHAVPGRIRLKHPAGRGESQLLSRLQSALEAVQGVYRVDASEVTGSLLVFYDSDDVVLPELAESVAVAAGASDPPGFADALIERIRSVGSASTPAPRLADSLPAFFSALDLEVQKAMGGTSLRSLVPAGFFVWGTLSLLGARKVLFPPWYELLWIAFGTYVALNSVEFTVPEDSAPQAETPRDTHVLL